MNKLDREVRAIEKKSREIIAKSSMVPGFLMCLESLPWSEFSMRELQQLQLAFQKAERKAGDVLTERIDKALPT